MHWAALIPIAWLGALQLRGIRRDRGYWLLAVAFGVSWLADTASHWVDPFVVSVVYLSAQAGVIGLVLLTRWQAAWFVVLLTITGFVALALHPTRKLDVLQHSVAWLGICAVALNRWEIGNVRTALLVAFLPLWVAWIWYVIAWPSFPAGYTVQTVRLVGLLSFSGAIWRTGHWLKLDRA